MNNVLQPPAEFRYRLHYSRHRTSVYQSHLDLMSTLIRAVRRSGLSYAVTRGCHVRPRVSFGPPLPLGHSSRCEFFDMYLTRFYESSVVSTAFSGLFPSGMSVISAEPVTSTAPMLSGAHSVRYALRFVPEATDALTCASAFLLDPHRKFSIIHSGKERYYTIGSAVINLFEKSDEHFKYLIVDFSQGTNSCPSVSKIVTALLQELGPLREFLLETERLEFLG